MSATIFIAPAEKDAKLYTHNGRLLMYIGRFTVDGEKVTVTPCRKHHRPATPLPRRLGADLLPPEPEHWREGPDGWTTHVSVRVDLDDAIAQALVEDSEFPNEVHYQPRC
jgi:hypothetical protein